MGNTIVLFGSTQVGKSTLAGYLASYNKPADEFNCDMQRFKKQAEGMGIYESAFLKTSWISCFTSMDYDELTRPNDGRSTTKRSHSTKASIPFDENNEPITTNIVDTIGFSIDKLNDYQDVFEATAGLVLITYSQAKEIVETKSKVNIQKLIQPLNFWCAFKPISKVAVIISQTKCFETDVSELIYPNNDIDEVNSVIDKIREYLPHKEIPIVPISVQTRCCDGLFERKGYNITHIIQNINACCLFDVLRKFDLTEESDLSTMESKVLARPTRLFPQYPAIRVNVMSGRLQIDDTVLMGPVVHQERLITVRGKISELRNDQYKGDPEKWPCASLSEGWIGGVKLEELRDAVSGMGIHEGLNELELTDTTLIFSDSGDSCCSIDNCLRIKVKLMDYQGWYANLLDAMLPKENVRLYYYGKPIVMCVLEKSRLQASGYIEYLIKLIKNDSTREVGFVHPSNATKTEISMPLLVRNGILIDAGSEKFYDSKIKCVIQQSENIQSDSEYRLVVNVPKNNLKPDDKLIYATWCTDEEENTKIIIDGLTLDNIGERLKQIRKYLEEWYISKCNFKIYKMNR